MYQLHISTYLVLCASTGNFHPQTCSRRLTFLQCHCGWWNHLPGTWSWEWHDGMCYPCNQSPSRPYIRHGNFLLFLVQHHFEAESTISHYNTILQVTLIRKFHKHRSSLKTGFFSFTSLNNLNYRSYQSPFWRHLPSTLTPSWTKKSTIINLVICFVSNVFKNLPIIGM